MTKPRKIKILKSPAKGAKRTAKQWAGAFRAIQPGPVAQVAAVLDRAAARKRERPLCEQERRQCTTWDPKTGTCTRATCPKAGPRYYVQSETIRGEPRAHFVSSVARYYASEVTTDQRQAERWCKRMNEGKMAARALGKSDTLLGAFHEAKLKPGIVVNGSVMTADEYSTVPRSLCGSLADYCVRQGDGDGKWGIYLRDFNVRVAVFADNSHPIREVLTRTFDSALRMTQKSSGWYTHGCGQWVHDTLAPCTVCKPKRRRK